MDRRQRKTREAIFRAFDELLSKKKASSITVGEIIECADVGRATFYAHFETRDHLLSEMCGELFCHLFDASENSGCEHKHIFDCDAPSSVYLHLFRHFKKNDNHILELLCDEQNEVFLRYFKDGMRDFVKKNSRDAVDDYRAVVITAAFIETVRWWASKGKENSAEDITELFLKTIGLNEEREISYGKS